MTETTLKIRLLKILSFLYVQRSLNKFTPEFLNKLKEFSSKSIDFLEELREEGILELRFRFLCPSCGADIFETTNLDDILNHFSKEKDIIICEICENEFYIENNIWTFYQLTESGKEKLLQFFQEGEGLSISYQSRSTVNGLQELAFKQLLFADKPESVNRIRGFLINDLTSHEKKDLIEKITAELLQCPNEDTFIKTVLIPLLRKLDFQDIRHRGHGPLEKGKDIDFVKKDEFGYEYWSAVVKNVKIHGSASVKGNYIEVLNEVKKAYSSPIKNINNGSQHHVKTVIVITSKNIGKYAREGIFDAITGEFIGRRILFLEGIDIAERIVKYKITIPKWNKN